MAIFCLLKVIFSVVINLKNHYSSVSKKNLKAGKVIVLLYFAFVSISSETGELLA
jgi:hypothetical protein